MPAIEDTNGEYIGSTLPVGKVNIMTIPSPTDAPRYLQAPVSDSYPGETMQVVDYYELAKAPTRCQFEIRPFGDTGLFLIVNVANNKVFTTFNPAEGIGACTRGASDAALWRIIPGSKDKTWYITKSSAGGVADKPIYAISYYWNFKQTEVRVVGETDMKAHENFAVWTILPA